MRELHSLNEIEICYRRKPIQQEVRRIQNSSDAIALLRQFYDKNRIHYQEESIAIFLNRNNDVLGFQKLSSGGLTGTIVDARILFSIALKTLSSGIILSHCLYRNNLMKSKSMDFEGLDDHEIFRGYFQLDIDTKKELNFTQNFRGTNVTKAN